MEMNVIESCCTPIGAGLDDHEASRLASVLKTLADPARLRILSIMARTDEVCGCDLEEPLGLSQPTVSHHLKQLREAGLVSSDRRGKWVYHRLIPERFDEVRDALDLSSRLTTA